jgi:hypothetical protein
MKIEIVRNGQYEWVEVETRWNADTQKFEQIQEGGGPSAEGGPGSGNYERKKGNAGAEKYKPNAAAQIKIMNSKGPFTRPPLKQISSIKELEIRMGQVSKDGKFVQNELKAGTPVYQYEPDFAYSPTMETSGEMYQKLDSDGSKMWSDPDKNGNIEPVISDERTAYLQELADYQITSSGATPVSPELIRNTMMGGSSGAGKSELLKREPNLTEKNAVTIDADAIKGMMGEYRDVQVDDERWRGAAAFVHSESSIVSDMALEKAVSGNYNTILDGTGDGPAGKFAERVDKLTRGGTVPLDMIYISIPLDQSLLSAERRAENIRRYIPPDVISTIQPKVSERFGDAVKMSGQDKYKISMKLYDRASADSMAITHIANVTHGRVETVGVSGSTAYNKFTSYAGK